MFTSVCGDDGWSTWTAICSSFNCIDFTSVLQQSPWVAESLQPQGFSFGVLIDILTEVIFPPQKCVDTVIPIVNVI